MLKKTGIDWPGRKLIRKLDVDQSVKIRVHNFKLTWYLKAVSLTGDRVTDPVNYFFLFGRGDQRIPEASSCKYLGIILCSDLSWAYQVNYTVQIAGKALHFTMCVLTKGIFLFFTGATTHCGFVFYSHLAGYSLLAYEIS